MSGEALDDAHRPAATGAVPGCAFGERWQRHRFASLSGEQGASQREQLFAEAVGQQAVTADAHEAPGQHVEEEAALEVHRIESHDALLIAVRIIAPAEADALAVEASDAVVGNRHAVGVASEITQDMLGSAEGRLGVGVPFLVAQLVDHLREVRRVTEGSGRTAQLEKAPAIELAESCKELFAEDPAQGWYRQQEHGMGGRDPALMIGRQSAAGNDAVDMVVGQQVRSPGVQDGQESDLCAEAPGIGSDFEQGLGDSFEEQIENRPARSQSQRVQFVRQGEDDMEVVGVEQIALLRLKPSLAGLCLAFWTTAGSA